jgi:hypothetical protein
MSFNSVTLIIATIIFIILLAMVGYFIYQEQKNKFDIPPSTCPDYWTLAEGSPYTCTPDDINIGSCTASQPPSVYTSLTKPGTLCDNFVNKYNFVTNTCSAGNNRITWDGVTNNPELVTKCQVLAPSS